MQHGEALSVRLHELHDGGLVVVDARAADHVLRDSVVSVAVRDDVRGTVLHHVASVVEGDHLVGDGAAQVLVRPHQREGSPVDHLELRARSVDRGAARGEGERGAELDAVAVRTHLVADIQRDAVDTAGSEARVAHHGAVHVQVVEREVAGGDLVRVLREAAHVDSVVAHLHVGKVDGTGFSRLVVHGTHGSHHVALRTQASQTVVLAANAVDDGLGHGERLLVVVALQREETRHEVLALLVGARQLVLGAVVGKIIAVGIGLLAVLRELRGGAGLPLDLVVGLRAHGDAHSDGEDLARADDGQRVFVQLEEGLHLALLTVHLGQSVLGVLDGDVVVRDLVAHQTADGAGEDEVGVPGAHADVVEAEHVRNSHITGDGGASAGEDVALLVQRHDHTRLDLGDLVEVGEGECVQRLLQVGLFVTQSAFRDLSSHVQADAAEDEGQHGEEDCTVGNEAAEEHGLLLFLSDNTV